MKVKTSAFAWDFSGTNIFQFLRYLKKDSAYVYDNRVLIVDELTGHDGVFWAGYLLSLREEKTFPKVKLTDDELEVILEDIGKDVHHGEFSFFLINVNTRKGLYQTYSNGARWTAFVKYLSHRFNKFLRDENIKDAMFIPSPIFREKTFETYVEQFDWIKEIRIESSYYAVTDKAYRRLDEEAQRRVEIFKFYKGSKSNLKAIKNALFDIATGEKTDRLKVDGTIAGVETACTLANNVEVFAEEEYGDWIQKLKFTDKHRENSVNSSQTIRDLIRIYRETLPLTRLDQREPEAK